MKYLFSQRKEKFDLLAKCGLKLRFSFFFRNQKMIFSTCYLCTCILAAIPQVAIAQQRSGRWRGNGEVFFAQTNPNNPLTIDRNDPLIPLGYGKRELSSFEKYRIKKEIASIGIDAKAALKQNNVEQAMKLWYRQLRLARTLDKKTEVKALGTVGEIAWSENRSTDVRNIAQRLITIQTESNLKKASTGSWLNQLAIAYEKVRYLDKAIDIYQILVENGRNNSMIARYSNLRKLGQLYLAIFNYQNAAYIYQELLNNNTNQEQQQSDLKILIGIYENTEQFDKAIAARKRLIQQHIVQNKIESTPSLEIAIARDFETLKQENKAIEAYARAWQSALKTRQLAIASDALKNIGKLYQQQGNLNKAIASYNKLIAIQQRSYNHYGLIDTYDTLGQIYLKLNLKERSQQYFQQGLELAKSLNYKVEYFKRQIN